MEILLVSTIIFRGITVVNSITMPITNASKLDWTRWYESVLAGYQLFKSLAQ